MTPPAIGLILAAAVAHASWNLFSKQASTSGAVFFLWLLAACATVVYLPVAAITDAVSRPHLTGLSWVFMVGTGVLEAAYFLFLQLGYRIGDLSLVYPVGRGTGALLAAIAGMVVLGERPGPVAIAGIVTILAGVVLISLPDRSPAKGEAEPVRHGIRAVALALVTGTFIASYTLWDKYAVASLHTPAVLQGYAAFPFMTLVFWPLVARDRGRLRKVWHEFRPQALGAAALAPLAYMLVLAALSFTAISAIAPAREVSVLFGVLLGRRMLGEHGLARRLGAAAAIVTGIIAIAIG